VHRDIKPQNVLVDMSTYQVKLCDFGAAKQLNGQKSISYICSRHYRAPELIFGQTLYDEKIDIWSAGCVMAEMFKLAPIFPGQHSGKQIIEIFKVLGTPNANDVSHLNKEYAFKTFPAYSGMPLESHFPSNCEADRDSLAFLNRIFVYDPDKRPSALHLLADSYFD